MRPPDPKVHPWRRSPAAALSLLSLLSLAACSSPNRGAWEGTFAGTVSGEVRFEINARGTSLSGQLSGTTRDRQPFAAEMRGKIRGEDFYATFDGKSRTGLLPVAFEGLMRGTLAAGAGRGDWTAELKPRGSGTMKGTWEVKQVPGS
jgi:hypothetical protein